MRSNRRNYSHRNVSLFRTKKDGSTRANIAYMTCSFLELDGSTDGTIKTRRDVFTLTRENNIPTASYVIETSKGHFHLVWNYNNPLPWTKKNESYWKAQQKRLIQLFEQGGFLVDKGASMNPTQNLRNPSQLNAYNFKRRCEVFIHTSYQKTSLRAIYRALNKTSIPNPRPIPASVKLRRYLRANKTFTLTLAELAENLGISLITAKRAVKQEIGNGGMSVDQRKGNNKGIKRTTEYISNLYIEPQFSEVSYSSSTTILSANRALLERFQTVGEEEGVRNKLIFALGLSLKLVMGLVTVGELVDVLGGGSRRSGVSDRELVRTLSNVLKSNYTNPLSMSKLREWGLLQETMGNSKYHAIPLH
ncbi:MAG: hypothetical protein IH823_05730 [Candidatus Dadabacteria bacterium]|nr:hypothetical protein [Candidatus Dadabacteria bacterium]